MDTRLGRRLGGWGRGWDAGTAARAWRRGSEGEVEVILL